MTPLLPLIGIPAIAALILALIPYPRLGVRMNAVASFLTLLAAIPLLANPPPPFDSQGLEGLFWWDELTAWLVAITVFVGFTGALTAIPFLDQELATERFTQRRARAFSSLFQLVIATLLITITADNLVLLWVAIAVTTLANIVMTVLHRTPEATSAAWKYFMLVGLGTLLALFGTLLLYLSAQSVLPASLAAMSWHQLRANAPELAPHLLQMAFAFLLVGYGTKAGLAPLHSWLPDTYASSPTPAAVLSGLIQNVAIYALLRFKMIVTSQPLSFDAGLWLLVLGLLSILFGALMLFRRRHVKRLFGYSSIQHAGVLAFAFGIGAPLANLAGLIHMATHTLIKSAAFFLLGAAIQARATMQITAMRGLTQSHPHLGWGLLLALIGLAGLPPFGLFTSEFLLISSLFAERPGLTMGLVLGLLLAFSAMVAWIQELCFGTPDENPPATATPPPDHAPLAVLGPVYLHLVLAVVLGFHLPLKAVTWLNQLSYQLM